MCEQGLEQCLSRVGGGNKRRSKSSFGAGVFRAGRGGLLPNHKGATIIFNLA